MKYTNPAPTRTEQKSICVFCGSSPGNHPRYVKLAQETGQAIAEHNFRLVYGGGGLGLMGASAKAAHNSGGKVLGIIPEFLKNVEMLLENIEHEIVDDMATRKKHMYEQSDAFIVLPGGIGTLEEAIEVMSWMRLQLHQKPMVFLDNDGYWKPLIALFDHTIEREFSPKWMRNDVFTTDTVQKALKIIEDKWQNPGPIRDLSRVPLEKL